MQELIEYTDWQRERWHDWLMREGPEALTVSIGANGDGRFGTAGEVIRHIFSAELRYVERLLDQPLSDAAALPSNDVTALFEFGERTRSELRSCVATLAPEAWDTMREFWLLNHLLKATPRKVLLHVMLHEIRHWAQLSTVYRLSGRKVEFHDILFSPVLGGTFSLGA